MVVLQNSENQNIGVQYPGSNEQTKSLEETFRLVASGANDGIWIWDLKKKEMYFSPRWKEMLGYQDHELGTDPQEWFGRIHRYHLALLQANLESYWRGDTPVFDLEYRIQHKDGSYRWVKTRGVAARGEDGKVSRMAGSQTDITHRVESEVKQQREALYDPLTGLANKGVFMDLLNRVFRRSLRVTDRHYAVLYADLDRFKILNDSLGHKLGDHLLMAIADRLKTCLRTSDVASHFGGDEFAILLEDLRDVSEATRVAERIQSELARPFLLGGHEIFTSASIGIAYSETGYEEPEHLLRDADTAMFRAKSLGKARHELFDLAMHENAMAVMRMEGDLRRALDRGEFEVHYQPIVSLEKGHITGFEALLRWRHAERGLVYPMEFIPLAEETGLILPICWWVFHKACEQLKEWQKKFPVHSPLTISMNFTSSHFAQKDFVRQIEKMLQKTGLCGHDLVLEITESIIMKDVHSVSNVLSQLKELEVQLHIDDFGTGYSSLSYLNRFPIDTLKIDRSFVGSMGAENENGEIVRTIVTLAHSLGMDVIAEGVETRQQMTQLRYLECEYGQGFYFSKALEAAAIERLLAQGSAFSTLL